MENHLSQKEILRKTLLQERKKIPLWERILKSERIVLILQKEISERFPNGANILFYAAKKDETDLSPLFHSISKDKFRCFFPKITNLEKREMRAVEVINLEELASSRNFHLLEPAFSEGVPPEEIDLVLLPAVAIDGEGNRLGYGKGFYDCFLQNVRPDCKKWATVFSLQKVEKIPSGWHDVPVDAVIDELSFHSFT